MQRQVLKYKKNLTRNISEHYEIYLLLIPIILYYVLFCYLPMGGLKMAFQDYLPVLSLDGSPWVGLEHFEKFLTGEYFASTLMNTLSISVYSMAVGTPLPIIFALLINTLTNEKAKKTIQTITYAPHFISTVVIVGMLKVFLSPSSGMINALIEFLGGERINFFANSQYFSHLYVWSGIWQQLGWNSVIYVSALAGVDPELHEAAMCDGASRLRRIWHVDLPGIKPTIVILLIMNCRGLIDVGFEKVFLMQTPTNMITSETISTYAYKLGMEQAQYSYSTAVNLLNSIVSLVLLIIVNGICKKLTEESLW